MSSTIDISKFLTRLRDLLDSLVDEFRDYDFTFKPLLTQSEFEEKVLPEIKEILTFKNRYIIVYNIFSNLIIESLENENKVLCLIDFLVNLSKYDSAFKPLPNDAIKDISSSKIFESLKKYIFNKNRIDYAFDPRLSGIDSEADANQKELEVDESSEESSDDDSRYYRQNVIKRPTRKRISNASLAAIERAIMNKKKSSGDLLPTKPKDIGKKNKRRRKASTKKLPFSAKEALARKIKLESTEKTPSTFTFGSFSAGKLRLRKHNESHEEESYRNKKMKLVMEEDMDFLYAKLDRSSKFIPELTNEARNGFFYKPPQYNLFAKYDKEADPEVAANLDCLFNKFMEQAYKRAAFGDIDQTPFLHESEYEYIMSSLSTFLNVVLPPLIFDQRPTIDLDTNMKDKSHIINMANLTIQPTKVKNLWRLKIFRSTVQYLKRFKNITSKDEAKMRFQWINSLITDGKSLYSCDKLDAIVRLMGSNPMLNVETDDEDENQDDYDEDASGDEFEDENAGITDDNWNDAPLDKENRAEQKEYGGYMDIRDKREPERVQNDNANQNSESDESRDSNVMIVDSGKQTDNSSTMSDMFKNSSLFVGSDDDDDDDDDFLSNASDKNGLEDKNNEGIAGKSRKQENNKKEMVPNGGKRKHRIPKGAHALSVGDFQGPTTDQTDNRQAVVTSARGIRLDSMHIRKHLSAKEFMRILAGIIFPEMKISARRPNNVVMTAVVKCFSKVFFNFRPYLIELFLADLDSFFTMPKYFKIDSVMVELQIEEMKKRNTLSEKSRRRMLYYS